jgi:gluconolactonase
MAARSPTEPFVTHHAAFSDLLGGNPQLDLLAEKKYPFAHEAGVFIASRNELFITSNRLTNDKGEPKVQLTKVNLGDGSELPTCEEIESDGIRMGNGGVNFLDDTSILVCDQGSMDSPSALYEMSTSPPYISKIVVSDFYGRSFNSVNDVVVHSDGSIWFTDPIYGYEQGYRPKPDLPNQLYRFDAKSKSIRAMADGFGRPNGICFSPDESIVYVTDTDWIHGDGTTDGMRPSTM